jgi:hypothetical protein
MTKIEQCVFKDSSTHCVRSFELTSHALTVTIAPWQNLDVTTRARFGALEIVSVDPSYGHGDLGLPWHIIGFDSEPISDDRWRFCLHCDSIEYVFKSASPEIT